MFPIRDGEIERQIHGHTNIDSSVAFALCSNTIHNMVKFTPKYVYLAKNRSLIHHDYTQYLNMLFTFNSFDLILKQVTNGFIKQDTLASSYYKFLMGVIDINLSCYLKKFHFFIEHLYRPATDDGYRIFYLVFKIALYPNSDSQFNVSFGKFLSKKIPGSWNTALTYHSRLIRLKPSTVEQYFEHFSKDETMIMYSTIVPESIDSFSRILEILYEDSELQKGINMKIFYILRYLMNNLNINCNNHAKLDSLCDLLLEIVDEHLIMCLLSLYLTNSKMWMLTTKTVMIINKNEFLACSINLGLCDHLSLENRTSITNFIIKKFKIHPNSIINIFYESVPRTNMGVYNFEFMILSTSVDIFFMLNWLVYNPEFTELVRKDPTLIRNMLLYTFYSTLPGRNVYQKISKEKLLYYVEYLCSLCDIKVGIEKDQLKVITLLYHGDKATQKFLQDYIQNDDNFIMKVLLDCNPQSELSSCIKPYVRYCIKHSINLQFSAFRLLLEKNIDFETILAAINITHDAFTSKSLVIGYITTNNIQLIEYYDKRFCVSYSNEFLLIHSIFEKGNQQNKFKHDFIRHIVKKLSREYLIISLLWCTFVERGVKFFPIILERLRSKQPFMGVQNPLDCKLAKVMKLGKFLAFYKDYKRITNILHLDYFPEYYINGETWIIPSKIIKNNYETNTLREMLFKLMADETNNFMTETGSSRNDELNYFMRTNDLL